MKIKKKFNLKKKKKQKPSKEINDENIKKIVQTKKPILDEKKLNKSQNLKKKKN